MDCEERCEGQPCRMAKGVEFHRKEACKEAWYCNIRNKRAHQMIEETRCLHKSVINFESLIENHKEFQDSEQVT